jgi:hypothetical protein
MPVSDSPVITDDVEVEVLKTAPFSPWRSVAVVVVTVPLTVRLKNSVSVYVPGPRTKSQNCSTVNGPTVAGAMIASLESEKVTGVVLVAVTHVSTPSD